MLSAAGDVRLHPFLSVLHMIRFRRVFDLSTETEQRRLANVQTLFQKVFPREQEYADRIEWLVRNRSSLGADVCVLTAEDQRGRILGFAVFLFFPNIRYGFLDYIGTDPDCRRRGIGQALYEGVREYLGHKRARGLLLEVPPDDRGPALANASVGRVNSARMKFYERFGAYPILGTRWDDPPVRPDYEPPYLVFDSLGRTSPLSRKDARAAAREILTIRYDRKSDDPFIKVVVESFADDPVLLRSPRYEVAHQPVKPTHGQLRPITVLASDHHEIHHIRERGYVERPARVHAILRALRKLPVEICSVPHVGETPIRAVHDADFVTYLKNATENLKPNETIYPEVFPIRRAERKPREMAIRAGYYCSDTFTPLSQAAYRAARAAVACAVAGADQLLAGETLVYSICRPPGHHAERRIYGGFCYFNNAAIAAHRLSTKGRVALLDIDYHHGNGQQDIFYQRSDVLTVSIHGHPRDHYPYFAGFADERGEGEGVGFNRNIPLTDTVGDDSYLVALEQALREIVRYKPVSLVVSLGFDIMQGDPTGNFGITPKGMHRIADAIGKLNLPTLVIQEGGYTLRNLHVGTTAFFSGLATTWYG